jgi:hypothetical protein
MKAFTQYPEVRTAWAGNEKVARGNHDFFFSCLMSFLTLKKPRFFRIHVAGDFVSQAYLDEWKKLAMQYPGTKFLAFTKRYDLDYFGRPQNLEIVFSAWPGLDMPATDLPIAYMQDGTETRVKNAIECPGNCETCGMCFSLSTIKKNVVFMAH